MSTLFTPVRLLNMVHETNSDYDDGLNGWLNYWTTVDEVEGSSWLHIEFLDSETDNLHYAAFEVFADVFTVDRNPRP